MNGIQCGQAWWSNVLDSRHGFWDRLFSFPYVWSIPVPSLENPNVQESLKLVLKKHAGKCEKRLDRPKNRSIHLFPRYSFENFDLSLDNNTKANVPVVFPPFVQLYTTDVDPLGKRKRFIEIIEALTDTKLTTDGVISSNW